MQQNEIIGSIYRPKCRLRTSSRKKSHHLTRKLGHYGTSLRLSAGGRNKMPLRGKVVITCAVTGSIHTPTMSPHLPLTPHEIARDAIAAAAAGAAILHLHARDPKDGRPTPDPDWLMQILSRNNQS